MSQNLIGADLVDVSADPLPDQGAPFVKVLVDRDAGRAIIALDAAAVDALLHLIDDIGPGYDLTMNPGHYGLDQDTANSLSAVIGQITAPLRKLDRAGTLY